MKQNFTDFSKWTEETKGLYRNVFCAGACYEILVTDWAVGSNILTAQADLYITGEWSIRGERNYTFSRELLVAGVSVQECMEEAQRDYDKNIEE